MHRADLVTGRDYAMRPSKDGDVTDPWIKVRYSGKAHRGRVQVRFMTGELSGLDEWLRTAQVVCPWGDRHKCQRDEERMQRLREVSAEAGDRVVEEAISAVFTASGEYGGFMRRWDTQPESASRLWRRAALDGSPLDHHPANFVDRHGVWQLTFQTAEAAAKGFAAAEPELVDLYLRGWEEELRASGFTPGNQHRHDLLREWAPSHALARSWSQEPVGVSAEHEVRRLRGLVIDAVNALRRLGHEQDAARISRALNGR